MAQDVKKRIKNYMCSHEEARIMALCIKAGFQVYPVVAKYRKKWPQVYLTYSYFGREIKPKNTEPFDQCYLGYEIHKWYAVIYEKKVKRMVSKPPPKRKVMLPKLPPPPPSKGLFPPPPPK